MGIFGKRGLTPRLRRLAAALCLCAALALPGCQVAPRYYVESYEQVKEDLADLDGIVFPDISRYEDSGTFTFIVEQYQKDRSIRCGYSVYTEGDGLDALGIDSTLSGASVAVYSLKHWGDELNPPPELSPNTEYRSVPMQVIDILPSAIDGGEVDDSEPLQGRENTFYYLFDLDGYRYIVGGSIIFSDDEIMTPIPQERLAAGKPEVLAIIDSILDQRVSGGRAP